VVFVAVGVEVFALAAESVVVRIKMNLGIVSIGSRATHCLAEVSCGPGMS
jgi:hypothetical protein